MRPSYTVIVTATDPAGQSDFITVTITVTNVNEPPDITAEDVKYAETMTAETANTGDVADLHGDGSLRMLGTMSPWDLSGADAALFSLSNAGLLTFDASPNYEMPGDADGDNVYEVTVGATDNDGNRGTKDIEVKVTNLNEDGTVTMSAVQPRVGVPLTASLTDIDGRSIRRHVAVEQEQALPYSMMPRRTRTRRPTATTVTTVTEEVP